MSGSPAPADPLRFDARCVARWLTERVAGLTFLAAGLPTLLAVFARRHWLCDVATSFPAQYASLAVVSCLAFLSVRRWQWAVAAGLIAVANLVAIWPAHREPAGNAGTPLRLVAANVHAANREHARFLRFVRETEPDVLLVLEVDGRWAAALAELRPSLPHRVIVPREDNFGIALLSRFPLATETLELGDAGVPSIVARFERDGRSVVLIGTHPVPPVRSRISAERNRQLAAVAATARKAGGAAVVAGDLNVTPWSPRFADLLRDGRLSDSRRGFGLQPTWPAYFPPLLTPIDHVLVGDDWAVLDRRIGPDVGSDHRPVIVEMAIRRPR